jgi:hypothetical protein
MPLIGAMPAAAEQSAAAPGSFAVIQAITAKVGEAARASHAGVPRASDALAFCRFAAELIMGLLRIGLASI